MKNKSNPHDFINDSTLQAPIQPSPEYKSEKDKSFKGGTAPRSNARERAEVDGIKEDISGKKANKEMKVNISEFSMLVTIISLCIWSVALFFQVMGKMSGIEVFNDIQLATITTGCTVNILAVILGVIRGLFK